MRAIILAAALLVASPALADDAYRAYRHEVNKVTEIEYRAYREQIDPQHLRGKPHGYDLDHIQPVKVCYIKEIPAEVCGAHWNLRVIPAHDNRSEGCRTCKAVEATGGQ